MSNNKRGIGNYEFSQLAFLDQDNFPMGVDTSPDTVVNGEDTGAYVYDANISLAGFTKTIDTIQFKGGAKVWGKYPIGVSDIGDIAVSMSGEDPTLASYFNNSLVDTTTNSNHTAWTPSHSNTEFPNFISVHHTRYHNVDGDTKWRNYVILNHTVKESTSPALSDSGGTNPNPVGYEFVPTRSNRLPWGQLISANANISVEGDRLYVYVIESDNPLLIHTYIDDNSGTSDAFTLDYLPATTTTANHYIYQEGVDDSSNIAIAADGDVTITAPNDAGDRVVIVYEAQYPLSLIHI